MMILFIGVSFQTYFTAPCAREFSGRARGIWVSVLLPTSASFLFLALARSTPPPASSPLFTLWGSRPPPFSSSWRRGAVLPPRPCVDLLWELGGPLRTAAVLVARSSDLPLGAEWQRRRQQHPRQRRRRPPRPLLFPNVRRASPPFPLQRTIARTALGFPRSSGRPSQGKDKTPGPPTSESRPWTQERLPAAWGCLRPGIGALRAGAGASCSCCCRLCCWGCCCGAPAGLRRRARRRRPPRICGRRVSGTEFPFFSSSHLGPHRNVVGLQREGNPCAAGGFGCVGFRRHKSQKFWAAY